MNFLLAALLAVTLTWTDNSDNEDGFIVYRSFPGASFTVLATMPSGVVTFDDKDTKPLACYKVTAFNIAGESEFSNTVCLPLPPNAPSGLQAKTLR
jgi:hypothetical protein